MLPGLCALEDAGPVLPGRRAGRLPSEVVDELAQIRMVDVVLPAQRGPEIRLRCVSRPEKHQAILLQRLRMRLPDRTRIKEM